MEFAETGMEMALGTGFIYEHLGLYYLITNGHCVTGVNPETRTRISRHAGYPTAIKAGVRTRDPEYIKQKLFEYSQTDPLLSKVDTEQLIHGSLKSEKLTFKLYQDEFHTRPAWFIHPQHGYLVDVVAIPIGEKGAIPAHVHLYPLNAFPFECEPEVSDDVFVLGYPFGITDPLEYPIWKKGSIATEPSIAFMGLPRMLIDTATRSGMSGSPVIIKRTGIHPTLEDSERFGTAAGFVGVYSGRYGVEKDNFNKDRLEKENVQLGIVWRKEVIEEIIIGHVSGTIDFQQL
ncbi:trypsin-like peptidase domain-containing protein [Hymenobacter sediminis]|uniref:trypsin-like peptidase domain-containing protein n=1 Tax=Hymenobacter sediminis TaxID=2218621 RepID=UPI00138FF5B3|nr:trypsin-like peptidase domain-containing protein [Hymenobacter sediminis]